jgi:ABC-2 type transport system ATP-binding protein
MDMQAVTAQGVNVVINGKPILRDIDLNIERGTFYGVIGPNGAGKSTLFNVLLGFRKPSAGMVSILGENPLPRNARLLQRVGVQPQQVAFFSKVTVREHLRAVAGIFGARTDRADDLLESLKIAPHADTRVEKLSGGERQRLALASALVHSPDLVFLDEPTAALDPEARQSLVELLHSADDLGTTIVYTTHHLDEAERLCDTVSIIDEGGIVATASPSKLIADTRLESTILLPLATRNANTVKAVAALNPITSAQMTSDGLSAKTPDVAAAFAALGDAGVNTTNAQVRNASLEDAYLRITGKHAYNHKENAR